jgi:hypothetical protein
MGPFPKEARFAYPSVLGCFLLQVKEFPVHCYCNIIYMVIKSTSRNTSGNYVFSAASIFLLSSLFKAYFSHLECHNFI